MNQAVIILGALSEIAEATARRLATRGARFVLAGRRADALDRLAADLKVRGAAETHVEVVDFATDHPARLAGWAATLGGADVVLLAYGQLGDHAALETDPQSARTFMDHNLGSATAWCLAAGEVLERQRHGTLAVIGSVAGDRGRQSNYIYGATKAGLAVLVQGLAHRLARSGARALLIKPGLVDTAMTAAMPKGGPLWSSPDRIARAIEAGIGSRNTVIYAPSYWAAVMAIIRTLPTAVLHRTRL